MTRNEALHILRTIKTIYPRFQLTEQVVKVLLPRLQEMDYDRVFKRLNAYVVESPFPPALSDIAAYPEKTDHSLEYYSQWREAHEQVPEETKRKFQEKVRALLGGVSE